MTTEKRGVFLCLHCGNKTSMEEVAKYTKEYPDYIELEPGMLQKIGTYTHAWKIYMCPSCDKVTLIFKEYCDYSDPPFLSTTQLYPSKTANFLGVPDKILKAYEAALKCRHLDGAMCAMGLRRTLEMICKDLGECEGQLHQKVTKLSEKGILPKGLSEVALILKEFGNTAAHGDGTEFPTETITNLIEFTEAIINYLYILPFNLNQIREKLNSIKTIL